MELLSNVNDKAFKVPVKTIMIIMYMCSLTLEVSKKKIVNPRSLEGARGGGQIDLDFFGFKFLLLDRLSKALAQLFLVCEHIF